MAAGPVAHVEVVGALDDAALTVEAETWTAFLHPIYCLSRGASKLALGLSWEIPVVTTPYGRRGYVWEEGGPLEAATPEAFVAACQALDPAAARRSPRRTARRGGLSDDRVRSPRRCARSLRSYRVATVEAITAKITLHSPDPTAQGIMGAATAPWRAGMAGWAGRRGESSGAETACMSMKPVA